MFKYNRLDFVESNLKPAVREAERNLMASLETTSSTFKKYCSRLGMVREQKEQRRLEMLGLYLS